MGMFFLDLEDYGEGEFCTRVNVHYEDGEVSEIIDPSTGVIVDFDELSLRDKEEVYRNLIYVVMADRMDAEHQKAWQQ